MERRTCCALVLRIAVVVVSACLSVCMSSAQELPKLKELSEREMMEHLVPGVRKGKWGYMNDKENFRIKPVFNAADEYKWTVVDGKDSVATAKVLFEGKYALLNRQGTFLFHPLFDSISDFDRGVALFVKDGKAGILTADGRILTDGLDEIRPFDANGLAWFMNDGKWGIY
ncbi:MAG: WG repeat-containing protein, partial [Bacteroidaceae bacterium]|nr:WG repeat-containing protein [Bacteroidaceae bacterium]